jgi:transposase
LAFFQKLAPCLVGIEACAASHHWSRQLQALGHTVRLMPPGQPSVTAISHDSEQLFNTIAPNRRNHPEFRKIGTDRVDHRSLLANKQVTGAVQHQAALLLGSLGGNEAHVGPGDRIADGLSIGSIVLLPLHRRLRITRRCVAALGAQLKVLKAQVRAFDRQIRGCRMSLSAGFPRTAGEHHYGAAGRAFTAPGAHWHADGARRVRRGVP